MRVLMITNNFTPYGFIGGAEVAAYHTCQGLLQRGVDCGVLALNHRLPEAFDREYALDRIPVHWVSLPRPRRNAVTDIYDPRLFRAVRRELERAQPDLVHIHNVSGATLAPHLACRTAGVPVVSALHDLWLLCPNNMLYRGNGVLCDPADRRPPCQGCFRRYDFWGAIPGRRALLRALTSHVRLFIVPSHSYAALHDRAGYQGRRFRVIPYGLLAGTGTQSRIPAAGAGQLEDGLPGQRVLFYAGGGHEHKGALVLLRAIPMLLRHVEGLRVVVAGGGEEHLLARFRACEPGVQVTGPLAHDQMQAAYALAELIVVPSVWYENSPVVIYEGYGAGVPAIGSCIGGIPELIRERETGYTFSRGCPVALAEKVILHFARPAYERRQMRQRCVEEARTRLSLERHTDATLSAYREALGQ